MMGMFFPDFFGVESYEKYARGANVGGFLATNRGAVSPISQHRVTIPRTSVSRYSVLIKNKTINN
jgi:hypothetical protein